MSLNLRHFVFINQSVKLPVIKFLDTVYGTQIHVVESANVEVGLSVYILKPLDNILIQLFEQKASIMSCVFGFIFLYVANWTHVFSNLHLFQQKKLL